MNYRSAGPLSVPVSVAVPVPVVGTRTGTKRKTLPGPEAGPKKKLPEPGPNKKSYRDQKKLVPHIRGATVKVIGLREKTV